MVSEKFQALPTTEQNADEKFAQIDLRDEKFASIGEMHKIFAEKFAEFN